ncbi:MAG: CBS domain-containing protein [Flavobacteriales bacterium]
MDLHDLITNDCKPLEPEDSTTHAHALFEASRLSHLPVVADKTYLGALAEETAFTARKKRVIDYQAHWEKERFINVEKNVLDAVQAITRFGGDLLPLLNDEHQYLGYLTTGDLIQQFSSWPIFQELGVVIVIETTVKRYSMSQIANIVESQNARILGCFISNYHGDKVTITLKINSENPSSLADHFARFGYEIKKKFYFDMGDDVLREHYLSLIKYLDI